MDRLSETFRYKLNANLQRREFRSFTETISWQVPGSLTLEWVPCCQELSVDLHEAHDSLQKPNSARYHSRALSTHEAEHHQLLQSGFTTPQGNLDDILDRQMTSTRMIRTLGGRMQAMESHEEQDLCSNMEMLLLSPEIADVDAGFERKHNEPDPDL
eukprot:TRINITY_DN39400_c0_g1_i1.p1 TRINITY_DN39400_c0_g1~~TRINITY_DN39400_c0_g1_i1.p1  ORF type:complete len:157 (-),score=29.40 TRINITY_DN39400_c0_g1_i1:149-619(-)